MASSNSSLRYDLCKQHIKQAFDSIAGNTVVPYRSLKKLFNYHKLLFIAIYNKNNCQIEIMMYICL